MHISIRNYEYDSVLHIFLNTHCGSLIGTQQLSKIRTTWNMAILQYCQPARYELEWWVVFVVIKIQGKKMPAKVGCYLTKKRKLLTKKKKKMNNLS